MATAGASTALRGGPPASSPMANRTARITSATFSARNTIRPMPSPIRTVTSGARNFSGASRKEMATTMPSQTNVVATASAVIGSPAAIVRSLRPAAQVGDAQVRFTEGDQIMHLGVAPASLHHTLHQAQVDGADRPRILRDEVEEGAVPQSERAGVPGRI